MAGLIRDRSGVLLAPAAFLLVLLCACGFGLLNLMHQWHRVATIQLELDRCVGKKTQELRDTLRFLGERNREILVLRATIRALTIKPEAQAPFRILLTAAVLPQDAAIAKWNVGRALWLVNGCSEIGEGWQAPLPGIPMTRWPPDDAGEQALEVNREELGDGLQVEASRSPRAAAAKVVESEEHQGWKAVWSAPQRIFRTGFP